MIRLRSTIYLYFYISELIRQKLMTGFSSKIVCMLTTSLTALRFQLIFFSGFMLACPSFAQVTDAMRVEIPAKSLNKTHHVELMGTDGVMVFFESNELSEAGERKWYFYMYSTNLEEKWIRYVLLKDGLSFDKTVRSGTKNYMLFSSKEQKKSQESAFQMIIYEINTEKFNLLGAPLQPDSQIKAFEILRNQALIFAQRQDEIEIITINLSSAQVSAKSSGIEGKANIQLSFANQSKGEVILSVKKYLSGRFDSEDFIAFDPYGQKKFEVSYKTDKPVFLHTYAVQPTEESYLIAGCYQQTENKRLKQKEEENSQIFETNGFFFLSFTPTGIISENYTALNDLDNLYSTLTSLELIQSRQRKNKSKRNERRVSLSIQLFNPTFFKSGANYVYSAEAFRPRFRTETRMDYDFYGRPIPYTYNVFDGFEYFAGIVNGFDNRGDLLWQNDLEMRDLISYDMNPHFKIFDDSEGMLLSYIGFGKIVSKMIMQSQTIGQSEQIKIEPKHANDRLQAEDNASLRHWYGNYFLASGYQKIINNRLRDDATRTVFYMNKVVLE